MHFACISNNFITKYSWTVVIQILIRLKQILYRKVSDLIKKNGKLYMCLEIIVSYKQMKQKQKFETVLNVHSPLILLRTCDTHLPKKVDFTVLLSKKNNMKKK